MKEIWSIIVGLILTFFVIWLAYKFSKTLGMKSMGRFKGKYLKEIDRLALGQEEYISIVQAGDGYYLIGVTKQNINCISKIDDEALTPIPTDESDRKPAAVSSEFLKKLTALRDKDKSFQKDMKND